jgi:hypothetical protein
MKLYKQFILNDNALSDPVLIKESNSHSKLKREAERLARLDGLQEFMWISGTDTNPEFAFPDELSVNDEYLFSIRIW